ncbi:MAG: hypothetical protein KKI16_07700 [Alphaproteobacteria bacterium]|jgi:hypothetical protein|nr:hypothetical protein [Idiomarinaceae bacterium]MBU0861845.1 hypothetical protein [Alphaproteobacteria bacterium]HBS99287.1 hypothetical protein [Citreicella sp.]
MPDARVSAAAPGLPSAKVPPALAAHLDTLHVRSAELQSMAKALRLLIVVDMIDRDFLTDLLDVILKTAKDMEQDLDGATLQNLPA